MAGPCFGEMDVCWLPWLNVINGDRNMMLLRRSIIRQNGTGRASSDRHLNGEKTCPLGY